MTSNLDKPIKIKLTKDQTKAFNILKKYKIVRSKFIRQAIEDKLHKDFRSILKQEQEFEQRRALPNWLFDD